MKFFLSYESAAPAAFYLTKLEPLFSAKLAALEPKNYGDELTDIGIISIVRRSSCPTTPSGDYFSEKAAPPIFGCKWTLPHSFIPSRRRDMKCMPRTFSSVFPRWNTRSPGNFSMRSCIGM